MANAYKNLRAPLALGAIALATSGCISVQAIEPVITPPKAFQGDRSVAVELAMPNMVGWRCAERGATFMGLPGLNSGACSDSELITIVDPCMTLTAGGYAVGLCEGAKRVRAEQLAINSARRQLQAAVRSGSPRLTTIALRPRPSLSTFADTPPRADSVWVEFVGSAQLASRCATDGFEPIHVDGNVIGCSNALTAVILNPCSDLYPGWYTRTLCHELGHANGWPSDHSGAYSFPNIRLASESPQALALSGK